MEATEPPSPAESPAPRHGPLLVIVGPTAVGKTETAIRLANAFNGEIISADSRQFYRGMDIGTAKATAEEQARAPHHLLDIRDPNETLTLAEFQALAYATIDALIAAGRLPILVGGTGLFVRAVVEGYGIPAVPPDEALRAKLFAEAEAHGMEALHARLAAVDPVSAGGIDPRNVRRVVRALEVWETTGEPLSRLQQKHPPPYTILQLGLTRPRERLYARADGRIQTMLAGGLVDEVRRLLAAGVDPQTEAMSGLGYREAVALLRGELPDEAALAREIERSTRRFIRHQANWFRLTDPAIHWFDLDVSPYEEIEAHVGNWLATQAR